jgi:MoaA/NifB/PqqE/SkfB family radical SAM enzyme
MNLFEKNRNRSVPTFANINLLGKCNANCFFCLGKEISGIDYRRDESVHFLQWPNFSDFVQKIRDNEIRKVYLTGQNTDSLLYHYLGEFIDWMQNNGFDVGLRTNGFRALQCMDEINRCNLETGYSIHSLVSETQKLMVGVAKVPDWKNILSRTNRKRISTVISRHNADEFFDIIRFASDVGNIDHFQVRRISTENRKKELKSHIEIYEELHNYVAASFPLVKEFYGAPIYNIFGVECTFWRTVQTNIGSINYFTDGTISDEYFIVEGYQKNRTLPLLMKAV